MMKERAQQDVQAVQKMLRRGRRMMSRELRLEQADDLGKLINCMNDEAHYIDNGGELISRLSAARLLGEVSHYAYDRDRFLGMRISRLGLHVYENKPWGETEEDNWEGAF